MNFLILILCVYIVWRVRKNRKQSRACAYYSHERTHTDTLIKLTKREVVDLRKELKNAGVIP